MKIQLHEQLPGNQAAGFKLGPQSLLHEIVVHFFLIAQVPFTDDFDSFGLDFDQDRDLKSLFFGIVLQVDVQHLTDTDAAKFNRRSHRQPPDRAV